MKAQAMKIEKRMNYIWFGELAKLNQQNIKETRAANPDVPFYLYTHSDHLDEYQKMGAFCEEHNITLVDIKMQKQTETLRHVNDWLAFSEIGYMRFLAASDRLRYTLDGCYSDDDNIVGAIPFDRDFKYGFFEVLCKDDHGRLRHSNNLFGFSQDNLVRKLTDKLASHFHELYFQRVKEALIKNKQNSVIATIHFFTGQMLSRAIYYYFCTLAPNFSKLRDYKQREIATEAVFYDRPIRLKKYCGGYYDEISPYQHLMYKCKIKFNTTDGKGLSFVLARDLSRIKEEIASEIKPELLDKLYKVLSTPTSAETLASSLPGALNPGRKQGLEIEGAKIGALTMLETLDLSH